MTLSPETLTLLVLLSLALSALALFILASSSTRRPRAGAAGPTEREGIVLEEHEREIRRLRDEVRHLAEADQRLRNLLQGNLQRVGLVRYDAFEDMGGRLSFSLALLDAGGTGVVVTSINGRQDTRCYAKTVEQGSSPHNLSEEEAEAIGRAMAGSASPVTT